MKKVKNKTVTKKELADLIADKLDVKQILSKQLIQDFIDTIIEELAKGNKIELRDFGILKTSQKKNRTGRNPKSGEEVQVPAKKIVKFKAGKLMRERVEKLEANG